MVNAPRNRQFFSNWPQMWYRASLGSFLKKWCGKFWNFDFFRFYGVKGEQKNKKNWKNGHFSLLTPRKMDKNAKIKISQLLFFNRHKDAPYQILAQSDQNCRYRSVIQRKIFFGFSWKFGHFLTKNVNLWPTYLK